MAIFYQEFKKTLILMIMFSIISAIAFAQGISKSELEKTSEASFKSQDETISDIELQETQDKRILGISMSPRFEDAVTYDVIRLRTRLQYGVTDNFEFRSELITYAGNFIRNNWEYGMASSLLVIKYRFKQWPGFAEIHSATGLNIRFPLGSPPKELSGRYTHFNPYIVFSRSLKRCPKVDTFVNLQFDIVSNTPFRENPEEERPNYSLRVTVGGVFYYNENLRFTSDISYWTNEIGGGSENKVFLTPGIYWIIPLKYTYFLPGTWQLATGIEIPVTNEDENYGIFFKIKWNFDIFRKTVRLDRYSFFRLKENQPEKFAI